MGAERGLSAADAAVRDSLSKGDTRGAATIAIQELGPEVFGFLHAATGGEVAAEEIFAIVSERIWRSLANFRWQCTLRTWVYVIARREMVRFVRRARRRDAGRATPSELAEIVDRVRTETRSALRTDKRNKLAAMRDELPIDDRTLLILRVDRGMEWGEIARAFLTEGERATEESTKREAARLRKRFQLVKERLATRAREEGLIS